MGGGACWIGDRSSSDGGDVCKQRITGVSTEADENGDGDKHVSEANSGHRSFALLVVCGSWHIDEGSLHRYLLSSVAPGRRSRMPLVYVHSCVLPDSVYLLVSSKRVSLDERK